MTVPGGDAEPQQIMLVEGNDGHARMIHRVVDELPMTVALRRYTDGESAIDDLLDRHATGSLPWLVLLSISLPGFDGLDVLRILQAHAITPTLPVIVYSRRREPELSRRCLDLGAASYLRQSPTIEPWLERLRDLPVIRDRLAPA